MGWEVRENLEIGNWLLVNPFNPPEKQLCDIPTKVLLCCAVFGKFLRGPVDINGGKTGGLNCRVDTIWLHQSKTIKKKL